MPQSEFLAFSASAVGCRWYNCRVIQPHLLEGGEFRRHDLLSAFYESPLQRCKVFAGVAVQLKGIYSHPGLQVEPIRLSLHTAPLYNGHTSRHQLEDIVLYEGRYLSTRLSSWGMTFDVVHVSNYFMSAGYWPQWNRTWSKKEIIEYVWMSTREVEATFNY